MDLKDLQTFRKALLAHDWYYTYSDDRNVYRNGAEREKELKEASEHSAEHKASYRDYSRFVFRKDPEECTKPDWAGIDVVALFRQVQKKLRSDQLEMKLEDFNRRLSVIVNNWGRVTSNYENRLIYGEHTPKTQSCPKLYCVSLPESFLEEWKTLKVECIEYIKALRTEGMWDTHKNMYLSSGTGLLGTSNLGGIRTDVFYLQYHGARFPIPLDAE
jgi:hypothetical protein